MMLAQFADMVENMAELDFNDQPGMQFRRALEEQCWFNNVIPHKTQRVVIAKMKVNINEFDKDDSNWERIVAGYAVILNKLYDIYGEDIVHMDGMEITFTV